MAVYNDFHVVFEQYNLHDAQMSRFCLPAMNAIVIQ